MKQATFLLTEFFRLLDARNIAYCAMGETHALPDHMAGAVDIVVAEATIPNLPQLFDEFCQRYRARLVQCLQHEYNAFYFVIAFTTHDERYGFLAIDVRGDYCRRGRKFLLADELLAKATPAIDWDGTRRGFSICAPPYEFTYYLLKKIDKQDLQMRHGAHLTRQWRRDPEAAKELLERFWGHTTEARLLTRAADSGDWSAVIKLLPRMRAALHRRVRIGVVNSVREWMRRWRRWRNPTGLLIAVLGPDGSGKSSVIAAVDRQIHQVFRQTAIVHLRPGFLYRPELTSVHTSPAQKTHGPIRSICRLLLFAADYALGYIFSLRGLLTRSYGLIFDRYYDDVLVDPTRYRYSGSLRFARSLRAFIPRPDLWLLLKAPAAILQSRKQHVPFAESERQQHEYRRLLLDQLHVAVVDASQPLENVIHQTATAVLERCEARTRTHLKLPTAARSSPLNTRALLFFCRHRIPVLSKLLRVIFNSDIYCKAPRDLKLPHPYGIVIHAKTQLGRDVTIMQQATIGATSNPGDDAPQIGNHVFIGAGARVLGAIQIGDRAVIGANAVITRDVPGDCTVVGANRIISGPEADSTQPPVLVDAIDVMEVTLTPVARAAAVGAHR